MVWWLRVFYNLYWLIGLVPIVFLWTAAFAGKMRISRRLFWGLYVLMFLLLLLVANLWHWPKAPSIAEHQLIIMGCLPFWLGLFYLAWRHFFAQVFFMGCVGVFGLLMFAVPLVMSLGPFASLPYHVRACFCLALVWALCFRYLRRKASKVMALLMNVSTDSTWRTTCLLPAGFFLLPFVYINMHTSGNAMSVSALVIRLLALVGLAATLHTLHASAAMLERNTIFLENLEQAHAIYQAWHERSMMTLAEFQKTRQLRHDLRHYCINLRYFLEGGDWERFRQMVAECESSLSGAKVKDSEGESHAGNS